MCPKVRMNPRIFRVFPRKAAFRREGTTSNELAYAPQNQIRMKQAKRILDAAVPFIPAGAKLDLVNEAIDDINQGIDFDNNNITADEDDRDDVADITLQAALDQCQSDPSCLLVDADQDLKGATKDKGGFRAQAINAIETAIGTN